MSVKRPLTIAVIFGGRSVEHDVSIVTGHQVIDAFDKTRYEVIPVYIDREGRWFTGDPLLNLKNFQNDVTSLAGVTPVLLSPAVNHHGLIINPNPSGLFAKSQIKRIDVVFPTIHGSHGEDGTLQGLLELADIPYVGCGVLASALANDKIMSKTVLQTFGVPVVDGLSIMRGHWQQDPEAILAKIQNTFEFPVFVKPATLGSSIGINRVADAHMLPIALDVAFNLDARVLVEPAVTHCIEINASVLGHGTEFTVSTLEQPVSWEEFLTYEEKYLRGGDGMKSADRIIPAPIDEALTQQIQAHAKTAFEAISGSGIARIDFLVKPKTQEIFLNEINTMPGSLSFYLWEATDMPASILVERLIQIARDKNAEKRRNSYDYRTDLITLTQQRGAKGAKGVKGIRSKLN